MLRVIIEKKPSVNIEDIKDLLCLRTAPSGGGLRSKLHPLNPPTAQQPFRQHERLAKRDTNMSTGTSKSPSEDYFNDLSQQPNDRNQSSQSPPERRQAEGDGWVPRPKRIACVVCRKRKLRCDGNKPSCGTCARLGHECAYDEVRRKSGPKRGYVKQLEARLGSRSFSPDPDCQDEKAKD